MDIKQRLSLLKDNYIKRNSNIIKQLENGQIDYQTFFREVKNNHRGYENMRAKLYKEVLESEHKTGQEVS